MSASKQSLSSSSPTTSSPTSTAWILGSSSASSSSSSSSSGTGFSAKASPNLTASLALPDLSTANVKKRSSKSPIILGPPTTSAITETARPGFGQLQPETNLNKAPPNWLLETEETRPLLQSSTAGSHTSHKAAAVELDSAALADLSAADKQYHFMGSADTLKSLFRLPLGTQSSGTAILVHKIGDTLVLDELQTSNGPKRVKGSSVAERDLYSKFLYHSVNKGGEQGEGEGAGSTSTGTGARSNSNRNSGGSSSRRHKASNQRTQSIDSDVDASQERFAPANNANAVFVQPPNPTKQFSTAYEATFADYDILVGSDLLVFESPEHPAVSLRLQDAEQPLSSARRLEYWLDNVLTNTPELVVCFHRKGIVQGYDLLQTDDLPYDGMGNAHFDPPAILDAAHLVLDFLRQNCSRQAGTYLLGRDDSSSSKPRLQLYDMSDASSTAFAYPVAMLCYRVGTKLLRRYQRQAYTPLEEADPEILHQARSLLQKCVAQLEAIGDDDNGNSSSSNGDGAAGDPEERELVLASAHEQLANTFMHGGVWDTAPSTQSNIDDLWSPHDLTDIANACTHLLACLRILSVLHLPAQGPLRLLILHEKAARACFERAGRLLNDNHFGQALFWQQLGLRMTQDDGTANSSSSSSNEESGGSGNDGSNDTEEEAALVLSEESAQQQLELARTRLRFLRGCLLVLHGDIWYRMAAAQADAADVAVEFEACVQNHAMDENVLATWPTMLDEGMNEHGIVEGGGGGGSGSSSNASEREEVQQQKQQQQTVDKLGMAARAYVHAQLYIDAEGAKGEWVILQRKLGSARNDLGQHYLHQQRITKALEYFRLGEAAFDAVGDHPNTALLKCNVGRVMLAMASTAGASNDTTESYFGRAVEQCQEAYELLAAAREVDPSVRSSVVQQLAGSLVSWAVSALAAASLRLSSMDALADKDAYLEAVEEAVAKVSDLLHRAQNVYKDSELRLAAANAHLHAANLYVSYSVDWLAPLQGKLGSTAAARFKERMDLAQQELEAAEQTLQPNVHPAGFLQVVLLRTRLVAANPHVGAGNNRAGTLAEAVRTLWRAADLMDVDEQLLASHHNAVMALFPQLLSQLQDLLGELLRLTNAQVQNGASSSSLVSSSSGHGGRSKASKIKAKAAKRREDRLQAVKQMFSAAVSTEPDWSLLALLYDLRQRFSTEELFQEV